MNSKMNQSASPKFPEKTSILSVEIFRLMREGSADSRTKAQELLQSAMAKPLSQPPAKNSGGCAPAGGCALPRSC
jgi:hypothetical protein